MDNSQKPQRLASAFYLIYFAAAGALFPYLNLYFKQVGMTTQQIGVLAALPTIATLIAAPLWGGIADAFNLHKRLLPLVIVGAMLPIPGFMESQAFVLLAVFVLMHSITTAPIVPLADNAVLEFLGDASDDYGKLRIWGAVGFGLAAWGAGYLAEKWGISTVFIVYMVGMALTALLARKFPAPPPIQPDSFLPGLRQMVRDRRWLGFLTAIFIVGVGFSILNNYFVIYLTDLGAGETLFGLSVAAAGVSELPIYMLSPYLLKTWKPRGMLLVAFVAFSIRGIAYSMIQDPRWAVAAQLLHGPSFSALWIAAVLYAGKITPKGLGASAQSALGAVMFGLAGGGGALVGAQLYDTVGPQMMFRIAALFGVVGLGIFAASEFATRQPSTVEVP